MGYQNVLVFDTENLSMMEASQTGSYGKLQIIWASLRYTWMLLTRYRKFAQPGSGYRGAAGADAAALELDPAEVTGALLETISVRDASLLWLRRFDEIPAATS